MLIFLYSSAHRPMFLCPNIIKPLKWAYFELVWWTRPNKEKEGRRTVLREAQLGPSMSLLPHTGQELPTLFWFFSSSNFWRVVYFRLNKKSQSCFNWINFFFCKVEIWDTDSKPHPNFWSPILFLVKFRLFEKHT
jgi:hypothetical protein